jgi:DNA-binding GntR family transcriptional regulator
MMPSEKVPPARQPKSGASGAARSVHSSADQIFRSVVEGLYEGRYVPGQRLVEAELTQTFGVSRGSVREALNRLAAERVVSLNLHRGAQIRSLSRKEAADTLVVLEPLIGLAARLAAERIGTSGARDRFTAVYERLLSFEHRADSFEMVRARNAFYRTLLEIGENDELARLLPSVQVHLVRVQFRMSRSARDGERFSEYRQIGDAVLAANARRAELAGRRHVRSIARALDALDDGAFATAR